MDLLNFWCLCLFFCHVVSQDPVANLPQGRVIGIKVFTENSIKPIEVFYGIPYAAPPIGKLRFSDQIQNCAYQLRDVYTTQLTKCFSPTLNFGLKTYCFIKKCICPLPDLQPPERHIGWRRTLFAHRMPSRCPDSGNGNDINEDCLYLNIWTPRKVDGSLLPVVIILYSDSWMKNGVNLPCQELAAEGLVVVTVNYRLHMLSFFTLKSITARGNLGILDQYMALIWVRENIAAFGGDPNSITLAGHSAGADSVLLHIVSPRSVGLFHRAIIMSPQKIWKAIDKDNVHTDFTLEKLSRKVTELLECSSERENETFQCLKAKSLSDIMSSFSLLQQNWTDVIQPIPDNFLPESEQYLPIAISSALASSKSSSIPLDVMIGTTDLEIISNDYNDEDIISYGIDQLYDRAISIFIPDILKLLSLDRSETSSFLAQVIQWEFLASKIRKDNEKEILNVIEAIARMETSAKWEAGCALLAARLARRTSQLYVYHYSQPSGTDLLGRQLNFTGATHGAELLALLGDALMLQTARRPATISEKEISNKFRKYIANFVRFGSPDNQKNWPRYMVGDSYINEICNIDLVDSNYRKTSKRISFWLHYLPRLSNKLTSSEQAEKITIGDDGRLRGGILALCGVTVTLLLLLGVSAIVLHRWRTRRPFDIDSHVAK